MLSDKKLRSASEGDLKDLRFRISGELTRRREEAEDRAGNGDAIRVLEEHATPSGSFQWQMRRCGHPNRCQRCKAGKLHGPYLYRFYSKNGKQKSEYIKLKDAAAMGFERPPAAYAR